MQRVRSQTEDEPQFQEILNNAIDKRRFAEVTTAGADVEFSIEHGLGTAPLGYLVISQDKAASTYKGATAWDTEKIYLKTSTATVALRVLIF